MHLNSAASQLRLRKWGAATKAASKVLDLEPVNVKALFRRAQAYREMEDYDLAEIDLKKAMEQEPNNRYGASSALRGDPNRVGGEL
jgi:FK506-binding protein 4/5